MRSKDCRLLAIDPERSSGQTLLEVVLAVGVMALITTSLVVFASKSVANSTYTKNKILANQYAKKLSEWLKSQRDESFTTFISKSGKTYCFTTLPVPDLDWPDDAACDITDPSLKIPDTPFFRQAILTTLSEGTPAKNYVKAEIKIIWIDSTRHEVNTEINLADWK